MVLIIKKISAVIIVLTLALQLSSVAFADDTPHISAKSAVVMHEGETIFAKNADLRLPMASTTKIMTAIIAIENCRDMDTAFEITAECCEIEGSSMYLEAGESYTVRELITGLLLASGNDAAEALALICAGDREAFISMMNDKAHELRLSDTHFVNPSGLPADDHYSTARDMAKLMQYCMQNPVFAEISSLKSAEIKNQCFTNHNKLLTIYDGCKGGKTGYTIAAGRCLATCCERDGLELVCVTMSAPDDWNDQCSLYDWAYANYRLINVSEASCTLVPVAGGTSRYAAVRSPKDLFVFIKNEEILEYEYELPPFVFAPVKALEHAGSMIIKKNGAPFAELELSYCTSADSRINERSISHDRKTSKSNIRLRSLLPQKG